LREPPPVLLGPMVQVCVVGDTASIVAVPVALITVPLPIPFSPAVLLVMTVLPPGVML